MHTRRGGAKAPSRRMVRGVVLGSVLITALHYTDNYLYIDDYPGPEWVERETVYIAWVLLTLIGIAGYLFYSDGRSTPAGMYLLVYSYTGLSSLGHYPYGSFEDFSMKMHAFIWTDALVGAAVFGCATWILLSGQARPAVARLPSRARTRPGRVKTSASTDPAEVLRSRSSRSVTPANIDDDDYEERRRVLKDD